MHNSIATLFFAIALTVLGGCGQTGPLFIPDSEAPTPPPLGSVDQAEPLSTVP